MEKLESMNASAGRKILVWALAAQMAVLTGPAWAAGPLPVPKDWTGITPDGTTMQVGAERVNATIGWQSFDIDQGYTVQFMDQSGNTTVNKVDAGNPSRILGSLLANGNIYLLNPDGILFGSTAKVNVGGLVASSMDYDPATRTFSNPGGGDITVEGGACINAGAFAYLVGKSVNVAGTINSGDTFIGAYGELTEPEIELATVNGGKIVLQLSDNTATEGGSIELTGDLTTGGSEAYSQGNVEIAAADAQRIALYAATDIHQAAGSWTASAPEVSLAARGDVIIDGAITAASGFTAKAKGKIYETESGVLKTTGDKDLVELEAGRGIAFANENNSFIRLNVHGAENESAPGTYNAIDGNVSVTVDGDREWKVIAPEITDADIPVKGVLATIGSPVNGNVTLANVGEDATIVLYKNGIEAGKGDVSIAADKAMVVTQGIQADNDVDVTSNTGHVFVKNSLTAKTGSVNVSTGEGNIHVGADIASGQDAALTSGNGNIHIGANIASGQNATLTTGNGKITVDNLVTANNGNVSLVTGAGVISINGKVIARSADVTEDKGNVTATTGEGNIHIGDNGENVKTVSADQDITLATDLGKIKIEGEALSKQGDITISAKSDSYIPGSMNILMGEKGKVQAAGSVNLQAENGDLTVTDRILSGDGLSADVHENGSVYFGRDVDVKEKITIFAENGDIQAAGNLVAGNAVELTADAGSVTVLGGVTATAGNVTATANDALTINKAVQARQDVTLTSTEGAITTGSTVTSDEGDANFRANGNLSLKSMVSVENGSLTAVSTGGKFTTANDLAAGKDITIQSADDILLPNVKTGLDGNLAVTSTGGNITQEAGTAVEAAGATALSATGDIVLANEGNDFQKAVSAKGAGVALSDGNAIELANVDAGETGSVVVKASEISATGDITAKDATMDGAVVVESGATVTTGTLTLKEDSSVAGTVTATTVDATGHTLTSSGQVTADGITADTLDVDGGKVSAATIAGDVDQDGGTVTASTSITGDADVAGEESQLTTPLLTGNLVQHAGKVTVDEVTGTATLDDGALTASKLGELEQSGGIVVAKDGSLEVTGTTTQSGGTLGDDNDAITLDGALTQTAGTINAQTLTLGGGAEQTDGATIQATSLVLDSEGERVSLVSVKNDFGSAQGVAGNLTIMDGTGGIVLNNLGAKTGALTVTTLDGGDITVPEGSAVKAENGTAMLTANGSAIVNGTVDAKSAIVVAENGDATVSGTLKSAGDVLVKAGNDATLAAGATVEASGNLAVDAGNRIEAQSDLTAGHDLTLVAGGGITVGGGALTAGNALVGKAGGDFSLTTATLVGKDIGLETAGNLTDAGATLTVSGLLLAKADGSLSLTGTASGHETGFVSSGDLTLDNVVADRFAATSTGGSVTVNAKKDLQLANLSGAKVTAEGVDGDEAGVEVSGLNGIQAAKDATLNGRDLKSGTTDNGTEKAGGQKTLPTGNLTVHGGEFAAIPGLIIYNGRPVQGNPDLLRNIRSGLAFLADIPELKTTQGVFGNPLFLDTEVVLTDMVPTGYVGYLPGTLSWLWDDAFPTATPNPWLEQPTLYPLHKLWAAKDAPKKDTDSAAPDH